MAVATHLAAKSALARLGYEAVGRRLGPMIEAGLVGTCGIIELEVRYSVRSHPEYEAVTRDRRLGYESFSMPDEVGTIVGAHHAATHSVEPEVRRVHADRVCRDARSVESTVPHARVVQARGDQEVAMTGRGVRRLMTSR